MCNIIEKIKIRIKQKEGCNLDVRERVNSNGKREVFVGYGHNVLADDNLNVGDVITAERAVQFFDHDFFWVLSQVRQLVNDFDKKPDNIKIVLCDMAYNNGIDGLIGYKKFLIAINENDWNKAADEIVDSYNYRRSDLKKRYIELEQLTRSAA